MRRIKRAPTLESLREWVTEGISTWLFRLVETGLIPARTGREGDGPATARRLHRFVRDVVTVNPVSGTELTAVQVHLLEFALEFVDWARLARDRRLRGLDWSRTSRFTPEQVAGRPAARVTSRSEVGECDVDRGERQEAARVRLVCPQAARA